MKIYNESKTEMLENVDLEKGYLKKDKLVLRVVPAQEEVQEQFHYEYKDYTNDKGEVYGRDRIKVIDVPYQPAVEEHEETEDIQVYVPYTEEELKVNKIAELKSLLLSTDYKAIKYAEGELTAEEYEPTKQQRKAWREEIRKLGG